MTEKKFSYYQFRKSLGYSVFVRFEDAEFEKQFVETLTLLGFDPVERDKVKDIELNPKETKILRVVKANARVAKKIASPEFGDNRFGDEQVSLVGSYSVYCYKNIGMMIYGSGTLMWELGVRSTNNQNALRVIFTRFLSFALKDQGVIGIWGVPVDEGFVVLSPKDANFESVFVDVKKQVILTYEGTKTLGADCQILRLDSTLQSEMKLLSPDELLSFLSQRTTFISPMGMKSYMRSDIWELAQTATGYVYPASKFQPRSAEAA